MPHLSRRRFLLVGGLGIASMAIACSAVKGGAPGEGGPALTTTASGRQFADLVVGSGAEAAAGKAVSVHYAGWLSDGKKFDASRDRGKPFEFDLGRGQVIKGWDEGVAGMRVGGVRKLVIPPHLGYGATPRGERIPANSTLTFEVELLDVQ